MSEQTTPDQKTQVLNPLSKQLQLVSASMLVNFDEWKKNKQLPVLMADHTSPFGPVAVYTFISSFFDGLDKHFAMTPEQLLGLMPPTHYKSSASPESLKKVTGLLGIVLLNFGFLLAKEYLQTLDHDELLLALDEISKEFSLSASETFGDASAFFTPEQQEALFNPVTAPAAEVVG